MARKVGIVCRDFEVEVDLLEKQSPKTSDAIWKALPIKAKAEIWKEEVYFRIPVKIEPENLTPKTQAGDVSYWPEEPSFCIFFGRSQPYSPVSTFARIRSGIENFRKVRTGDRIEVRKA